LRGAGEAPLAASQRFVQFAERRGAVGFWALFRSESVKTHGGSRRKLERSGASWSNGVGGASKVHGRMQNRNQLRARGGRKWAYLFRARRRSPTHGRDLLSANRGTVGRETEGNGVSEWIAGVFPRRVTVILLAPTFGLAFDAMTGFPSRPGASRRGCEL